MKVSLRTIKEISVGDVVETRWGNDLIQFNVLEILSPGGRFVAWSLKCEILGCSLDFYEGAL